ncbi:putative Co/Zn/Cd efflux system membrane fusion protein [Indibacter alkaliphilus LW1]|uniref:Co/Zn/Cd efflux system membrane fusion protein n=1 Tax=Indibacter alkaliphilus (strain CCUG 57479 / KCTC 22604 / LW1) TaxID=1189612 RepID=S2CY51_INDAL|nr:efflux RND transporter periplasmic adaptor subunit [Indibacter alkaliphilus]EOZ92067.1 putative Co/Zn/Cd efflux system membrane fusion protein [Indibacter alkaliphilus LW1]
MRKKLTINIISLIIFLVAGNSCKNENTEKSPEKVTVKEASLEEVHFSRNFPATAVALEEVELRADVVGYITGIHIKEGQQVKKGQLLYQVDPTRYQARKQQAEAAASIAEANLERIQKDFQRYERLKAENAIAAQIYDNATVELRNAEQELNAAKSELENTNIDLQYASIYAPFDGTIGFSQVRMGSLVNPGESLLNIISRDNPMGVDFYPEERYLGKFQELASYPKVLEDSIFSIRLPDGSDYPIPGKIEILDRAVNRNTGTVQIRLKFDNNESKIRPGMSLTLFVKETDNEKVILVPRSSLKEQMGEFSVFVVEENIAKQVKVKPGRNYMDKTVILEGLESGQKVVVKGIQKIKDGDEIEIIEEEDR